MEFENKMTIFYKKRNGAIVATCSGVQSMSFFGEDSEDYSLIRDFTVVELDMFVLENISNFRVENGELKLIVNEELQKYR